ncbi:MAG: response regulator transcription factor [Coprobacillus sp.]
MKILIVEDEKAIAELMMMNLKRVGYDCDYAQDGKVGADKIETENYDLILLDIMLPEIDGYELMEYIEPMGIPVIFITAKGSVKDKVKGLHMGADDYLVKPFSIDELLARVESVLRRYHKGMQIINILNLTIDTASHHVYLDQQVIELTHKEYDLLLFLVQNKNIALYRDILYQKIWGEEFFDNTRTLDLHIQRLRKKLGWQEVIKTVYKVGYMLEEHNEICR